MTWILIVVWYSTISISGATMQGSGNGEGVTMQKFSTVQACKFAGEKIKANTKNVRVLCVPQG